MMGNAHTPGPWEASTPAQRLIHEGSDITHFGVYTIKTRGELNAEGHQYRPDPDCVDNIDIVQVQFVRDLPLEEANANARLIAAAPDLLAAAKALMAVEDESEDGIFDRRAECDTWKSDELGAAFAALEAAIAKAEGRS